MSYRAHYFMLRNQNTLEHNISIVLVRTIHFLTLLRTIYRAAMECIHAVAMRYLKLYRETPVQHNEIRSFILSAHEAMELENEVEVGYDMES